MHSKKIIGNFGERYAFGLLQKSGYKIIAKNFKSKIGEIDAVCLKDNVLIFVEVKTRISRKFGLPEEAVTPYKIRKIARVGDLFVKLNPNLPKKMRIDVVSLIIKDRQVESEKIIEVI